MFRIRWLSDLQKACFSLPYLVGTSVYRVRADKANEGFHIIKATFTNPGGAASCGGGNSLLNVPGSDS